MQIGIIIPCFNRIEQLINLIEQLIEQEKQLDLEKIIIVSVVTGVEKIDYNNIDSEKLKVDIIYGPSYWWYTDTMNAGFKYISKFHPDYILCLNDDLVLAANYLNSVVASITEAPRGAIIGSASFTLESPHLVLSLGIRKFIRLRMKGVSYRSFLSEINLNEITGLHESKVLPGRGLLIPFNTLCELNFFDKRFKQYQSDGDFCLRARKKGIPVLINWDAKLFTSGIQSSSSSSFVKTKFKDFIISFFYPYSRRYIPNIALYIWRHGIKIAFPLTFLIFIASSFKAFLFNKKLG